MHSWTKRPCLNANLVFHRYNPALWHLLTEPSPLNKGNFFTTDNND